MSRSIRQVFITWLFSLILQACNWPVDITGGLNAVQLAKHSVLYWLQEQAILYNNKVYWFNTLPSHSSPLAFHPPPLFLLPSLADTVYNFSLV